MAFSCEKSAKLQELISRQQLDAAKEVFYDSIDELDSRTDFYHAAFVLTYASEPDFAMAEHLYAKALEAGFGKFWLHYHRGNMYFRTSRWKEAVLDFVTAYRENPHSLVRDILMETLRSAAAEADASIFPTVFQAAIPVMVRLWADGGATVQRAGFAASLATLAEPLPVPEEHAWTEGFQPETDINKAFEASVGRFQSITLDRQVFVNSVPKSGTHLLRNLLVHFFGHSGLPYFLTVDTLGNAKPLAAHGRCLMFGHLPFDGDSLFCVRGIPQILLMRDPVENLLALARAAYDPRIDRPDYVFARRFLTIREYMTALVQGYEIEGVRVAPFDRFMQEFLMGWSSSSLLLIDYKEILAIVSRPNSPEAMEILSVLLDYCGSTLPPDWKERVEAAGNRGISSTYLPPLPDDVRMSALDHARNLMTGYAPGVMTWYERMVAKKLGER